MPELDPVGLTSSPADLSLIEGKNLCDPVTDSRGVEHAFSHAIPWFEKQTVLCYGCFCGWEGRQADFNMHMATAYGDQFSIDPTTGYPASGGSR